MNKNFTFLLTISFFFIFSNFLFAQNTWNAMSNGIWGTASNWSGGAPNGQDMLINTDYTVTHDATGLDVMSVALFNGADLIINSGTTLTTTSSGDGNDGFSINSGSTLIINGILDISGFTGDGLDQNEATTFENAGTLTIDGSSTNSLDADHGIEIGYDFSNTGTISISDFSIGWGIDIRSSAAGRSITNSNILTITNCKKGIEFDNSAELTNTGTVSISSITDNLIEGSGTFINNGTFKGNGTINSSSFDFGTGTLAPGTSVGSLTFNAATTFTSTSDIEFEIEGSSVPGTDYDQVVVNGNLDLNDVVLTLVEGSYTPLPGDVFTLIDVTGGTLSGTFNGIAEGGAVIFKGVDLIVSYTSNTVTLVAECTFDDDYELKSQEDVNAFCNGGTNCTITGFLKIEHKEGTAITDLSPLSCIVAVGGELKVKKCDITNLTGLGNITSVGGSLKFEGNASLPDLNGLGSIGAIGGELKVSGNTLLADISGLKIITSVGTNLKIESNPALTSIFGLHNISGAISNDLKINGNTLLTSIAELSGITSVGHNLEIDGNPVLGTLNGLQGITTVGNDLKIKNNAILGSTGETDCISIPAGICTAVNNGGWHKITYSGNFSTCNLDESEVEAGCLVALPVELIEFRAKEDQQQNVVLLWATASEINNMQFVIERSADGRSFEILDDVNGNGTTTVGQSYSYVDTKPISVAYYRLKQVDYDGSFEYSDVIFWENKKIQSNEIIAYPTVAKNEINLRFTTMGVRESLLKIVDSYGRMMYKEVVESSDDLEYRKVDLANFESGIYYIILSDGFNNATTKFVVAKNK